MDLSNSNKVYNYAKENFAFSDVEEVWCIALNSLSELIDSRLISRGTVNSCMAHPRDIFRFGLRQNAVSLILVHNHPSGDVRPSEEDIMLTCSIRSAGEMLKIPLSDHLIFSNRSYFSFADSGWKFEKLLRLS